MADRYNLISISIRNFRGIEFAEIDFTKSSVPRDIMTFYGHQGSGKSTLILAIQWCAYGTELHIEKNKLHSSRLHANHLVGQEKPPISVMMRFRPMGHGFLPSDDIACKRVYETGKRDLLEVTIGDTTHDPLQSEDYFRQIFGSSPKFEEGVMWVIRKEEMNRMAQTISPDKNSYFLDFMNLHVPYGGLTELNNEYHDELIKLSKSRSSNTSTNPSALESQIAGTKRLILQKETAFKDEAIKRARAKPTPKEERHADAKEVFDQHNRRVSEAKLNLSDLRIRQDELPGLINALLFSKLKEAGIEIEESFASSEFEWKRIADFLETTQRIPPNVIQTIRELSTESGYNTSTLIAGEENIASWSTRIRNLMKAKADYNEAIGLIRSLEADGITAESTAAADIKIRTARELNDRCKLLNDDIITLKDELKGLEKELKKLRKSEQKKSKNKELTMSITAKKTIVSSLMDVITQTNHSYSQKMFEKTIDRVKYFWSEIDQIGKYIPELIDKPEPQFALRNLETNAIQPIQIDGESGDAAGGETQLLLVCTCLAVSESSGAKMPIILDDCFTDVDKATREKLVKTVAKHFGSLIFVTNDPDKADLLQESEGRLVLNWPKDWTTVNQTNLDQWKRWM